MRVAIRVTAFSPAFFAFRISPLRTCNIRRSANFCALLLVGQFAGAGPWLGKIALRPAVELAFLYGRITRGVSLTDASPEDAVVGGRVPILLIHGLSDNNIPFHQSEWIHSYNPADIALWEVPGAGHCGAVGAAPQQFDSRVIAWFSAHNHPFSEDK